MADRTTQRDGRQEVLLTPAADLGEAVTRRLEISREVLPVNGVHSARYLRDCVAETASALDFQPRLRTLYVFAAPMTALARRLAATGLSCVEFAFGEVCDLDRGVLDVEIEFCLRDGVRLIRMPARAAVTCSASTSGGCRSSPPRADRARSRGERADQRSAETIRAWNCSSAR